MSVGGVLQQLYADLSHLSVYEMSSRGPLFEYLRKRTRHFTCSEFFDDVRPGRYRDGVQCQDVQRLTYPDASFDLCTSTEVFEHVADDLCGFREILRVLRPGGRFVFTVPLTDAEVTVERAAIVNGMIRHLMEPEYHGDAIRGHGKVLCFRNYGNDILTRLRTCGFDKVRVARADSSVWWGLACKVLIAEKT
jgi:SAM-dependent methyltransferase